MGIIPYNIFNGIVSKAVNPVQRIHCNASDVVNPLQCICSSPPVAVHLLQFTGCSVCGVEHPMCIHYSAVLSVRCIQYVHPVRCCCCFQAELAFLCMNEFSILQCGIWIICLCPETSCQ